ncbi:MAG TPA: glycerophosphodiester phosphodiesterase family protein [Pyrinomonadaceae bacterium]|nr:glycerophosphodiester phosphodiesterase family protein [Pyrinomonadaceae bacterium]
MKLRATQRATREAATTTAPSTSAMPSASNLPLIIGHRGASLVAPENTLAAFTRALADGADGLEFDVRLARDGFPVVIHDATLRRTARVDAPVSSLSSTELAATDVGSWFNRRFPARARDEYARESVPTLSRVFELVAARSRVLYVELKCDGRDAATLVERVVADVRAHRVEQRVRIESFTLAAIEEVKRIAPDLRTSAAFERRRTRPLLAPRTLLRRALACRADELALGRSLVSRRMIEAARAAGLPAVVWTVDHPSWVRRAQALGLHALITNDPAGTRAALNELGHEESRLSNR